jgi:hypothetical protein
MTICGAANFHLAKPTAGSFEDPGLRRAASMIAVIAGIARDRKCKTYHRGIENSKARR